VKWLNDVKPFFMARRTPTFHLVRVVIEDRFPATRPDFIFDLDEHSSSWPSPNAPMQSSPIVSWRSNFYGRSYRGRTFWGPFGANDLESPVYTDALIDAVEDWALAHYTAFHAPLSPYVPRGVIFSRQHNLAPDLPGRCAPIENFIRPHLLAVQRRRMVGYHPYP